MRHWNPAWCVAAFSHLNSLCCPLPGLVRPLQNRRPLMATRRQMELHESSETSVHSNSVTTSPSSLEKPWVCGESVVFLCVKGAQIYGNRALAVLGVIVLPCERKRIGILRRTLAYATVSHVPTTLRRELTDALSSRMDSFSEDLASLTQACGYLGSLISLGFTMHLLEI